MAALRFIHPERLRRRMLHRAGVLASHPVVGNPAVLRGRFAVLGEIGVFVDLALGIIVFNPSNMPQVAYVHIQTLKRDAPMIYEHIKFYIETTLINPQTICNQ